VRIAAAAAAGGPLFVEMLITHGFRIGLFTGSLGVLLYVLLMWSYAFAVFTSPGTPLDNVCFFSSSYHSC
jgi:hypothetical protein